MAAPAGRTVTVTVQDAAAGLDARRTPSRTPGRDRDGGESEARVGLGPLGRPQPRRCRADVHPDKRLGDAATRSLATDTVTVTHWQAESESGRGPRPARGTGSAEAPPGPRPLGRIWQFPSPTRSRSPAPALALASCGPQGLPVARACNHHDASDRTSPSQRTALWIITTESRRTRDLVSGARGRLGVSHWHDSDMIRVIVSRSWRRHWHPDRDSDYHNQHRFCSVFSACHVLVKEGTRSCLTLPTISHFLLTFTRCKNNSSTIHARSLHFSTSVVKQHQLATSCCAASGKKPPQCRLSG